MEVGAAQRLTLIADVVGRSFLDTLQLRPERGDRRLTRRPGDGIPPVTSEAFATVEPQNGTLRSILGRLA